MPTCFASPELDFQSISFILMSNDSLDVLTTSSSWDTKTSLGCDYAFVVRHKSFNQLIDYNSKKRNAELN